MDTGRHNPAQPAHATHEERHVDQNWIRSKQTQIDASTLSLSRVCMMVLMYRRTDILPFSHQRIRKFRLILWYSKYTTEKKKTKVNERTRISKIRAWGDGMKGQEWAKTEG